MIELAFVACLIAEPSTCEDKAMQFVDVPMTACVMAAQPLLAAWASEHPGWAIRRWACRSAGSRLSA